MTEDILEDPVGEGSTGLVAEHSEFRVMRYRASTLDEVSKTPSGWHVHRVHIHFCEERCWRGDDRRDEDIASLSNLAEVT